MNGTIAESLKGRRRIHIDSNVVIYFIEKHAVYGSIVRPLFELVDRGILVGVSSYITLLEIMVQPIRRGNTALALEYRDYLVQSKNFELFPVDRAIAEESAEIRAKYEFTKTPDAIQLATALNHRADAFVTNDRSLKRFDRLEVLVLDDFLPRAGVSEGAR